MERFLGLSERWADYGRARYAVLPVPYDATTSFQGGTRWGPRAVIAASPQLEEFDEEYGREFHKCGIATLDAVEPRAAGPAEMHQAVYRAARRVVRDGKFVIGLGGEHSITSALVRAVLTRHRKLSVLQIDAHPDLRDSYQGSPYSHACVMRRVWEMGVRVVPVGVRCWSAEEHRFIKARGIEPVTARETMESAGWMGRVVDALGPEVYVTVDIDGFDPAYAPGTGTPEPGGLNWPQVSDLLKAVAGQRKVVGADVVEVVPVPGGVQTEFLAAKVVYKLIAHVEAHA